MLGLREHTRGAGARGEAGRRGPPKAEASPADVCLPDGSPHRPAQGATPEWRGVSRREWKQAPRECPWPPRALVHHAPLRTASRLADPLASAPSPRLTDGHRGGAAQPGGDAVMRNPKEPQSCSGVSSVTKILQGKGDPPCTGSPTPPRQDRGKTAGRGSGRWSSA